MTENNHPVTAKPATLFVIDANRAPKLLQLQGNATLGRDLSCDIPVASALTAEKQGVFTYDPADDSYYYADLDSANRTFIDGTNDGARPVKLSDGDILRIDQNPFGALHPQAVLILFSRSFTPDTRWYTVDIADDAKITIGSGAGHMIRLDDGAEQAVIQKTASGLTISGQGNLLVNGAALQGAKLLFDYDVIRIAGITLLIMGNTILYSSRASQIPQPKKDDVAVEPVRKKSKLPIILAIILVVCLLAAGGVFAFLMMNREADDAEPRRTNSKTTSISENGSDTGSEEVTVTEEETLQTLTMPSCIGIDAEKVKAKLTSDGWTVETEEAFSDSVPAGRVIAQSVSEGSQMEPGSTVLLTVSKGPDVSPYDYAQKVVVKGSGSSATLTLYNWNNGGWAETFSCSASVGSSGIGSDYGEGKNVTPQGLFKLGVVLCTSDLTTTMPTQRVTSDTCVVDDPSSPLYNQITSISSLPSGTHYDPLGNVIASGKSVACIYIEHNGDGHSSAGVVPGKGSAITICGMTTSLHGTAGCIDISAQNMQTLLSLLDYSKNPQIEIQNG